MSTNKPSTIGTKILVKKSSYDNASSSKIGLASNYKPNQVTDSKSMKSKNTTNRSNARPKKPLTSIKSKKISKTAVKSVPQIFTSKMAQKSNPQNHQSTTNAVNKTTKSTFKPANNLQSTKPANAIKTTTQTTTGPKKDKRSSNGPKSLKTEDHLNGQPEQPANYFDEEDLRFAASMKVNLKDLEQYGEFLRQRDGLKDTIAASVRELFHGAKRERVDAFLQNLLAAQLVKTRTGKVRNMEDYFMKAYDTVTRKGFIRQGKRKDLAIKYSGHVLDHKECEDKKRAAEAEALEDDVVNKSGEMSPIAVRTDNLKDGGITPVESGVVEYNDDEEDVEEKGFWDSLDKLLACNSEMTQEGKSCARLGSLRKSNKHVFQASSGSLKNISVRTGLYGNKFSSKDLGKKYFLEDYGIQNQRSYYLEKEMPDPFLVNFRNFRSVLTFI